MNDLTNLANNFKDIYYPSVQKSIVDAYKSNEPLGNIIHAMIDINEKRACIKYGLFQRTKLRSASKFEWDDPREADGVPIFAKPKLGSTKVNNKLHSPFDRALISTNSGYFAGITPTITTTDENADLSEYHMDSLLMEMTQTAIGRGSGFSLLTAKEGSIYINPVSDWSSLVMYDYITKQPVFGLVYEKILSYDTDEQAKKEDYYNIWFYTDREVVTGKYLGGSFTQENTEVHGFNDVPLVEFPNNTERVGDVELTLSLQDAYDIANSDLSSEISQLRLAYLMIKNEGTDWDDKDTEAMTKTGVILLGKDGEANFVEKNVNASPVENLKTNLEEDIYKYSLSYDPDKVRSGDVTAFQIQQSMTKLEESAIEREKVFTPAIKRIVNMINGFKGLTGGSIGEFESVTYTRNVPSNIINDLKAVKEAGLNIDQRTLSELVSIDLDYDEIEERLKEQDQRIMEEFRSEEIKESID